MSICWLTAADIRGAVNPCSCVPKRSKSHDAGLQRGQCDFNRRLLTCRDNRWACDEALLASVGRRREHDVRASGALSFASALAAAGRCRGPGHEIMNDRPDAVLAQLQDRQSDRQMKTPRPGAAGIEIQHALNGLD